MIETEISELREFDTTYCDLKTKVLFSDWGTIPAVRIMAFVQTREGKAIYSIRGIAKVCKLPKSTVADTLNLLVEKEFLLKKNSKYFANNQMQVSDPPDSVRLTGKSVRPTGQSVRSTGHNNQFNNQDNINKASPKNRRKDCQEYVPPWDRPDYKPETRSIAEIKAEIAKRKFSNPEVKYDPSRD